MLEVTDLHAYYGKSHILQGVNMNIQEGEIVALLGRNGVGRSTTCKAIMGDVPPVGSVKFKGQEIAGKKPFEVANIGLGYVPENRDIFPGMTTRQNLILGLKPGQKDGAGRWSMENMFDLFSNLKERADVEASVLSGGEQQRVGIARAVINRPSILLADEPTGNLDDDLSDEIIDIFRDFNRVGVTVLIATHDLRQIDRLGCASLELSKGEISAYHAAPAFELTQEHREQSDFF